MADSGILDRNLVALSTRHPDLTSRLSALAPRKDLSVAGSRTGRPVPVLVRDGRQFPMHSRFDPESEGIRIAGGAPAGYLVAFGLGGGYHLTPLLENRSLTGLIVVESDACLVRGLLELVDLTRLFSDSRVVLVVDPTPELLVHVILERYLPVLYGNLGSITLRSRWDAEPDWFSRRADVLKGLPEALGRDYTVQTRFGRRWFVHTMANLARSEEVSVALPTARRILISAAGPSLEYQLPLLRKMQSEGAALLATDTSLPLLAAENIEPDIVLSIDCQAVSYHHFLKGLPEKTVLILDLASPPALTRLTDRMLFFASGHPFSLYLNRLYRRFPILDLSGGNVTHAAMSLAGIIGAREVRLFGADFSYPDGRPYARGTYLYPYFQSRSDRVNSSENRFWTFITDSHPKRETGEDGWRYRTASMDHYRKSLEKTVTEADFSFIPVPGRGAPIQPEKSGTRKIRGNPDRLSPMVSAGPAMSKWQDFLEDYRLRLTRLPPLNGPPQDYLEVLGMDNRQAWATLLPSAATFRGGSRSGPEAVEKARLWTMNRIEALLKRFYADSQVTVP